MLVNKMDLVGYADERFGAVSRDYRAYLGGLGVAPSFVIPISPATATTSSTARQRMPWYQAPTVVAALDGFQARAPPADLPLRLPIQDVYKFDERRIIAGRIESGRLEVGDALLFSPSNKTARWSAIEAWHARGARAKPRPGESIGITLRPSRSSSSAARSRAMSSTPPIETNVFTAGCSGWAATRCSAASSIA